MRLTAAGMAAAAAVPAKAAPEGDIGVRVTAGARRFAAEQALQWQPAAGPSTGAIVLDPSRTYQEVLGFGAAFTDAACSVFNQLPAAAREPLFRELFHPSEMGLSVCRTCIGSSDYSTKVYSFDDGDPDPELRRFSVVHDREYILPMLRLAREVNPALFLFSSPWSPPGWMKANGSMLGGSMRKSSFAVYARYLVKFLQAYEGEGVAVNAITSQNEVDTDQEGKMPACLWGQEYEIEFIAKNLGPELARNKLATKIWILDHNYDLWGRAVCTLDAPGVSQYVDGVAWHGYGGDASAMTRVHVAHPDKHAYWTEGGPDYTDPAYLTDWTKWSATFAGILRNWARCIVGWNLALDEKGRPNIGPFPCGGLVTIHSQTKEISRSGEYWAFAHFSRAIRRGARRIGSEGAIENVSHVAFANPDGSSAAVLTNGGPEKKVRVELAGRMAEVTMPADSVVTLTWS
jgi:glucosylceramidase